jgi:hypothetical protein
MKEKLGYLKKVDLLWLRVGRWAISILFEQCSQTTSTSKSAHGWNLPSRISKVLLAPLFHFQQEFKRWCVHIISYPLFSNEFCFSNRSHASVASVLPDLWWVSDSESCGTPETCGARSGSFTSSGAPGHLTAGGNPEMYALNSQFGDGTLRTHVLYISVCIIMYIYIYIIYHNISHIMYHIWDNFNVWKPVTKRV